MYPDYESSKCSVIGAAVIIICRNMSDAETYSVGNHLSGMSITLIYGL